jgi:hypothetical protein
MPFKKATSKNWKIGMMEEWNTGMMVWKDDSNISLFQFLMRISTHPEIGISTNCLGIFDPVF